ncbi:MAG: 50S ribosomal protein L9, partial [Synergistaceae bacterium]|nr:50S ribosomal protein L9 [Synergistaceae bacterium]
VAELLEQQHNLKIDKRDIKLDDSIRQAGNYNITLKLYPGVQAAMTLAVSVK